MASRRFFGYDPYDYYYTSPYHYPYPYYSHHQSAPARRAGTFFPAADQYYGYRQEPAPVRHAGGFFPTTGDVDACYRPAPARSAGGFFPPPGNVEPAVARAESRPEARSSRSVAIPVNLVGSESGVARTPVKRVPSAEQAATRLQAAARGYLARSAVRALRAVEREAEEVAGEVAREAEALHGDARARVAVGEALMRLLLRLDAVRGARGYRRRVARRVLALQDAVDALEQRPVAGAAVAGDGEAEAPETATVGTVAEENAVAAEIPSAVVEENGVTEAAVAMEVDGNRAAAEDAETNVSGDTPAADEEAEGEWEMVAEDPAAALPAASQSPQPQEPAEDKETTTKPAVAGGVNGGVDTKKLMDMVAALCERSAQQCAVIGALAKRVDALERAVRRVEDAERRRRRAKKLRKEGKGSNHTKCYSDDEPNSENL